MLLAQDNPTSADPEYKHKLCSHAQDIADPEVRDKTANNSDKFRITKYIQKRFPGLEDSPAVVESCMYTRTPDETSIIDSVPGHKNIVFACGFSGTGFKKAPEVGRMMFQLMFPPSEDRSMFSPGNDIDLKPFSLSRFKNRESKL